MWREEGELGGGGLKMLFLNFYIFNNNFNSRYHHPIFDTVVQYWIQIYGIR